MSDLRDALEPLTIGMGGRREHPEVKAMSRRFWLCVVLSIPVLLIGMSDAIPGCVCSTVARQIGVNGSNWPYDSGGSLGERLFFVRAWQSIVNRSLNMFTLIAVGVGAAYVYSVVAVIAPGIFPTLSGAMARSVFTLKQQPSLRRWCC